jgi:hypothetical protein
MDQFSGHFLRLVVEMEVDEISEYFVLDLLLLAEYQDADIR